MSQSVIRVANFREHQVCVETVIRRGSSGSLRSSRSRRRAGQARGAVRSRLVGGITAAPGSKRLIGFLIMIECDFVLALNQVEITQRVFRRSNSTRVVGLRKIFQR